MRAFTLVENPPSTEVAMRDPEPDYKPGNLGRLASV